MGCGKIMNKKSKAAVSAGMFQHENTPFLTAKKQTEFSSAGGGWGSSV